MELYISFVSLFISILAVITPFVLYKKQQKDSEKLNLEVRLMLSNLGAGEEYRYEYVLINNSQKTTYIKEVYIEYYEFDQYLTRIKYIGQASAGESLLPYSSIIGFIGEEEKFKEPNIYIAVVIYTQEFEAARSNLFDPRRNIPVSTKQIKKMKKQTRFN